MKTGFRTKSRKERLDHLAWKGEGMSLEQYTKAWPLLMGELCSMADPERRPPKFNDVLEAIARAQMKARRPQ